MQAIAVEFHLKDDNGKLYRVKVIIVSFLNVEGTVDVLTGSNTDVKVVETQIVHFARLKLSPRLEKVNKLDCDYQYWQISLLFCPLKYHVTLSLSHQS